MEKEVEKSKDREEKSILHFSFDDEESEEEAKKWKKKCKELERQVDTCRVEEGKWKERYEIMERKKEERIHILEKELNFGLEEYRRRMVSNSSEEYFDL